MLKSLKRNNESVIRGRDYEGGRSSDSFGMYKLIVDSCFLGSLVTSFPCKLTLLVETEAGNRASGSGNGLAGTIGRSDMLAENRFLAEALPYISAPSAALRRAADAGGGWDCTEEATLSAGWRYISKSYTLASAMLAEFMYGALEVGFSYSC